MGISDWFAGESSLEELDYGLTGELVTEVTTAGENNRLEGGAWTGTDAGGFAIRGGNDVCAGESVTVDGLTQLDPHYSTSTAKGSK